MKKLQSLLPLSIALLLAIAFQTFTAMAFDTGTPQVKKTSNITYIDIGIYQPNVEDCYEMSVPYTGMEHDWIKIYPNPNSGLFTLELNLQQPGKNLLIHVYDITGKLVFQIRETPDESHFRKELDVSYFQKGVYFIRITGKDRVGVKQIIIN